MSVEETMNKIEKVLDKIKYKAFGKITVNKANNSQIYQVQGWPLGSAKCKSATKLRTERDSGQD